MRFTEFVTSVCGLALTDGQRVACRVCFDSVDPAELNEADRRIAAEIFGPIQRVPASCREVIVLIMGARSGKSRIFIGLRVLHLALSVDLSCLAPGEHAAAVIVAPDLRLARQTLRFVTGAVKAVPALARLVIAETADSTTLQRDDGRTVTIETLPATARGSAVRGRSLVAAGLDETCFHRDAEFVINDKDVFDAVAPRIVPGGQVIIASTPWAEVGLTWQLFDRNHGAPVSCLAGRASTLVMRDDPRTRAMVEREAERDPDNCDREYHARFLGGGAGLFFDPSAIAASVDPGLPSYLPRVPRARVGAAVDFGFASDSSALAIVQDLGGSRTLSALVELKPERGSPLRPSTVVETFAAILKQYDQTGAWGDGYCRAPLQEHLQAHNLTLHALPEGNSGKVAQYTGARTLLHQGLVRIPRHPRLIAQLRGVMVRATSGGLLTITSPRRHGLGHGDLVSALTGALWALERTVWPRDWKASTSSPRESADMGGY